ncbi:hypothetical protein AQUCO_02000084v1 [Aquilegia coerulea]|uniref:MI domain-containing protein n=1 Tax=Aquilegia coerulea TaxID=218851 RepID=A0A2G5DFU5_AQUCA|nr:hypothetical protein AQUCO_02000084v1 [Aquilegia coerulea]
MVDSWGRRREGNDKKRRRERGVDDDHHQEGVCVYVPPCKSARSGILHKHVEEKSSLEYQRLAWDALKKSINGLVNKVNATNVKNIVLELFDENLIRGRGLFCRCIMKSQLVSPKLTDVFAALVAVINTKFQQVGELLARRIVLQFNRAYKRKDKIQLLATSRFIAHLVNQRVVDDGIALDDDSIEVAVGFVKECGALLQELLPRGLNGVFERLRGILVEGEISNRVQFLIEDVFAIRKTKFQGYPIVRPELDLVDDDEQFSHQLSLEVEDVMDPETCLDIFTPDPKFQENEKRYEELKRNILGDETSAEMEEEAMVDEDESDDEEEAEEKMKITDETGSNLVNLRQTIYLTIMESLDFEEAGHKLLKIKLSPGQGMELCNMILECCSHEKTYRRFYGLLGQRFCMMNKIYQEDFEKCFVQQYSTVHHLELEKIHNVAKFFAHLLGTDALPWHVFSYIRLTKEDTTSSSRIFLKTFFQELSELLGIRSLNKRFADPAMQDCFHNIFPKDNRENTIFSIDYFTSIGLGGITENLREYLKSLSKASMQRRRDPGSRDYSPANSTSSRCSDDIGSPFNTCKNQRFVL